MIRVGVAGWDYDDWRGPVYPVPAPKGFDPLAYLAGYFQAIEVNATFYRPLPAPVARSWARRVAHLPDFRFTAKLWKRFTHERDAVFTASDVRAARAVPDALQEEGRLGALLVQFPWSFKRDASSREWLRDVAAALRGLPLVVEVRHASWNVPEFYRSLSEQGIGFVNLDQPIFRNSLGPSAIATAAVGYLRIHGRNAEDWFRATATRDERYDYLYTAEELVPWAERARAVASAPGVTDVYVVTNNHFAGQEVANAAMLRSMIEGRRVSVPGTLRALHPALLAPWTEDADAEPPPAPDGP